MNPIYPMCAHRYKKGHKRCDFPFFVQPKLNGIRALYRDGEIWSRDGIFFAPSRLVTLRDELLRLVPKGITLDGELYVHGWSLQRINGAASVKSEIEKPDSTRLLYHVFDLVDETAKLDFSVRYRALRKLFLNVREDSRLRLVSTHVAKTQQELDNYFATCISHGYEGAMLRKDEPYGLLHNCTNKANRWFSLLKLKERPDAEFKVVGVEEGEGRNAGRLGALVCETEDGVRFNVGGGFSDLDRVNYWRHPPIGRYATVSYFEWSDEGRPTQASFLTLRDV